MQKQLIVSLKIDTKPSWNMDRNIDNALKDECQLVEQCIAYGIQMHRTDSQNKAGSLSDSHLFLA